MRGAYRSYGFGPNIRGAARDRSHSAMAASRDRSPWAKTYGMMMYPRRRFQPTPMRFNDVGDYINSPGMPGSSTYFLYGLGEQVATQPAPSIWTTIAENVKSMTETALPAYMQYKVWKENLKRAQQDKAPLDPNLYAPNMRVQVSPSPEVMSTVRNTGIGVAGLAIAGIGLYLLMKRR